MSMHWWEKAVPKNKGRIEDALVKGTPRPADPRGHLLGKLKDDWDTISAVNAGRIDPQLVIVEMSCVGCAVKVKVVCSRLITDNHSRWLCEDCLDSGFRWAKDVNRQEFFHYQIVKEFPDDTLMRRLDCSPNPRGEIHDPFDPADRRRIAVPAPAVDYCKDPFDPSDGSVRTSEVCDSECLGGGSAGSGASNTGSGSSVNSPDGSVS